MAEKPKLEVIEIQLGIDPIPIGDIHPETKEKIKNLVEFTVKEKQALDQIKLRPEQTKKAYSMLYAKMEETKLNPGDNHILAKDLIYETRTTNLSTLIQALNKHIKEKGNIWKLKRKIIKGENAYFLTVS